jgi:hypothetical protein
VPTREGASHWAERKGVDNLETKIVKKYPRFKPNLIVLVCLFALITIMAYACTNTGNALQASINSVDVYPVDKDSCTFRILIEAGVNVDTSSHYDLTMTIKDRYTGDYTCTTTNISVTCPYSNKEGTFELVAVEVTKTSIPELVEEIYKAFNEKKAETTAEYNEFEDKMSYELGQQWSSGGTFPKYSYDEMQRLLKQEKELYDAMTNIQIDYDSICRKFITISIENSAP